MSIDNVIGSYGICNTASFNVLAINDEQVVGGINVLTIEDSSVYDIKWGLFDEDGEFVDYESEYDEDYTTTRSYIMVNDLHIFIDEIERIKFDINHCENVFDGFSCNEHYTENCDDADCDSLYCHTCNACNTCR